MDMTAPIRPPEIDLDCRVVSRLISRMGDKWTVLIVTLLVERPHRFNELKRLIGSISQQMLTRTLRALEVDGLVSRTVYPTTPPQVEYALTELGHSLAIPLKQLSGWVLDHLDEVLAHRTRAVRR